MLAKQLRGPPCAVKPSSQVGRQVVPLDRLGLAAHVPAVPLSGGRLMRCCGPSVHGSGSPQRASSVSTPFRQLRWPVLWYPSSQFGPQDCPLASKEVHLDDGWPCPPLISAEASHASGRHPSVDPTKGWPSIFHATEAGPEAKHRTDALAVPVQEPIDPSWLVAHDPSPPMLNPAAQMKVHSSAVFPVQCCWAPL
jgi:hypothetical protein